MIDYAKLLQEALNILAPQQHEPRAQQTPPPTLTYPGGLKVGLTAFGSPYTFNLGEAVNEFKQYIDNNSRVKLDLHFVQTDDLLPTEIPQYGSNGVCYMVTLQSLSPVSRAKMPSGMRTDIVLYDTKDRVNCFGGLQWSYTVPFICIPYSKSPNWDAGWKTPLGACLVHEFTHALFTLIGKKGFRGLPNIDRAADYGYTIQNDPGWLGFRKHCLGLITQDMADALLKD